MQNNNSKWFFLVILAIVWGSSFILIKKGLVGLTPIQLASVRVVSAAIVMFIIGFKHIISIPKHKWKYIAASAMFGIFIPAFSFAYAQTQIDSTISSILNALTPLNTLIIGALFFSVVSQKRQYFGVLIGFIGCLILIVRGANLHQEQNYWYALLPVMACVFYAININWVKKHLSDIKPAQIAIGNLAVLFLPSLLILLSSGIGQTIHLPETQTSIFYTFLLGMFSTGLASLLFYRLIQISSPVFASSTTYLIPVVAALFGYFDGESLEMIQLFGALIILVGVYFSSRK